MWNPFRRKSESAKQASLGLRAQALGCGASDLGLKSTEDMATVWGILMEEGIPGGGYTLVAFGEGSTSIYFFPAGGIIGAGQHTPVRLATERWLSLSQRIFSSVPVGSPDQRPANGETRITLRTFSGDRSVLVRSSEIRSPGHPLFDLYAAGQDVVSAVREASKGRA